MELVGLCADSRQNGIGWSRTSFHAPHSKKPALHNNNIHQHKSQCDLSAEFLSTWTEGYWNHMAKFRTKPGLLGTSRENSVRTFHIINEKIHYCITGFDLLKKIIVQKCWNWNILVSFIIINHYMTWTLWKSPLRSMRNWDESTDVALRFSIYLHPPKTAISLGLILS